MCPRSQVRLCPLGLLQRFTEHSGYLLLNKPPQLGDRATTIHQPLRVKEPDCTAGGRPGSTSGLPGVFRQAQWAGGLPCGWAPSAWWQGY